MLPYVWVYNHFRLVGWAPHHNWWMHALAFIYCDAGHYW
jgi:hypothetical protein